MISLTLLEKLSIPLEADTITPDNLHDKTNDQIKRQTVYWGNKKKTIGDFFDAQGEMSDRITVTGDCSKVKLIGHKMSFGAVHVKGSVGYNTGSFMTGGTLTIDGNAADYLGAMMEGGVIRLEGNAGHFTGGAYKGETVGMTGGEIVVKGNAGHETGGFMRRGMIGVGGSAGDFTGLFMLAGTIVVLGRAGERAGANMQRGSIILMNETRLLPSFFLNGVVSTPAVDMVMRRLRELGLNPPAGGRYVRHTGDANTIGRGEILVRVGNRNHVRV